MRYLFVAGGGLLFASVAGKTFIRFYRLMKSRESIMKTGAILGKYYKGGFQSKMNKTEASMILGLRESSANDKIMAAHRKLMFLNHPDNGGSTFLATKVNEAKEVLLK
jgi:DnaJ family protein C protein 19